MSVPRGDQRGGARRQRVTRRVAFLGPVGVGLVVLFTLIALIGFALRSPQPHGIPVGVVGPPAAVAQLSAGFAAKAPGALQLTPYATEAAARAAVDGRSVDAALVLGPGSARLIVAGAAGPAISGAITEIVGAETRRTYFRLGYGFSRSRNGAVNMHAAQCIAAVTGAWQHEGGGAFHTNNAIFGLDKTMIEGSDVHDPSIRLLDQSRIGAIFSAARPSRCTAVRR